MPARRIELTRSAQKELMRLPGPVRRRIAEALDALAKGDVADVKKLKGTRATWRLRVGDYRGIFERNGDTCVFTRFAHRSHVYDV
ncbi:MAG: type II toxin-antitoxin system RelE/ParE family toxin [Candidatus Thermoplasmatota archaeon]|jgi:mRNA interferase RelE/StbE